MIVVHDISGFEGIIIELWIHVKNWEKVGNVEASTLWQELEVLLGD